MNIIVAKINGINGQNIILKVSSADRHCFDALPDGPSANSVIVYDVNTARSYLITRADCGLGCYCAARAYRVLNGSQISTADTTDTVELTEQRRSDALDEIYPARTK